MDYVHFQIKAASIEQVLRALALGGSPMEMHGLGIVAVPQETSCYVGLHAIDRRRNLKFHYQRKWISFPFHLEVRLIKTCVSTIPNCHQLIEELIIKCENQRRQVKGIALRLLIAMGDCSDPPQFGYFSGHLSGDL